MKQFSKDLGNVSLAPKGKWSREQEYERLALVYNACDNLSYVAKIDVPSGVDIENREYWQPMNATGYADNNFINLTAENENGTITAYETLEEAVATILPINRKAGATLSFYNLNSDRLDRQAEFELWQFNSTDLANWENRDYWNNIYYNWNVFVGWYVGADSLKNHVKIPNVGQYAYVGTNLNDAVLYQCRTNGTWTNTGTKVRNYISVVVDGNITIGENGNWFSDGKDTGIPATPAVDEQLDNIGLQLQQHNTEIDKLQRQDVALKSNIDSNFETINNKVDSIKTATDNKIDAADANLQDQITNNDTDIANLNTKHESLSRTVQGIAATGGASTANNVTYNNSSSGLNAENAQDAIDELVKSLKDEFSYKGIAQPTINPGVPDNNVFYIAGEGSYPNFNNQVVEVGQIAVLKWDGSWHKEVLEIGADGGNMILDWDTDVATTRKQVLQKYRKQLLQISYKNANGDTVNEQYIGTLFTDTEWVKDTNWIYIPNASQISELSSNILEIRKSLSNSKTFLFTYADCTTVGILKKDGTVNESYTNGKVSDFVEIKGNWIIDAVNTYPLQPLYVGLVLTKEDKTTIVGVSGGTFKIDTKDYPEAKYMRYCFIDSVRAGITISQNLVELDKVQENVDSVSNILKLNDEEKYINIEISKENKAGDVIGDIVGFNHPLDADSYLQSIYISETEKTFGDTTLAYVGIIDQYNLFVVSKVVECAVTGIQFGSIILEPTSPCLINKGEIVLVGVEKSRWGHNVSYPEYGGYPVKVSKSTYMAEKLLNCPFVFVVNVRKIVYKDFASQQEVDNISNEISAIKNQFILHDEGNGNNYKVIVYNGELKLKLLAYNKILCIGNSFTYSPKRSLWPEEGRNMLASVNSSQYVEMIKLAANAEKVDKLFARSFEYAANDTSIDTYNFESELPITDDYDAIIIQLGENNKGTYKSWTKLYQYVRSKCPTADIFHVTGWFSPTDNIVKAASEQKVTTIDCSKECSPGKYAVGDFIKADDGSNFEINDSAVAYHPSDYGFYGFAKKILYTLGIDTKKIDDKIHNITILETANGIVTTPYNQWYEGGIVNIRITANDGHSFSQITVTGAGGTTYQADVIDGTKGKRAIFPMPNEDVTVNVTFI